MFYFPNDVLRGAETDFEIVKAAAGTKSALVGTTARSHDGADWEMFNDGSVGSFWISAGIKLFPVGEGEEVQVFDWSGFDNRLVGFEIFEGINTFDVAVDEVVLGQLEESDFAFAADYIISFGVFEGLVGEEGGVDSADDDFNFRIGFFEGKRQKNSFVVKGGKTSNANRLRF